VFAEACWHWRWSEGEAAGQPPRRRTASVEENTVTKEKTKVKEDGKESKMPRFCRIVIVMPLDSSAAALARRGGRGGGVAASQNGGHAQFDLFFERRRLPAFKERVPACNATLTSTSFIT